MVAGLWGYRERVLQAGQRVPRGQRALVQLAEDVLCLAHHPPHRRAVAAQLVHGPRQHRRRRFVPGQ